MSRWTPWRRRTPTGSPSRPTRTCRAASRRGRPRALDCASTASTGRPSPRRSCAGVSTAASEPTVTGTAGSTSRSTPTRYGVSDCIPISPPPRPSARPRPAGGMPPRNAGPRTGRAGRGVRGILRDGLRWILSRSPEHPGVWSRVGGPRKDAPLPAGKCRCRACPALNSEPHTAVCGVGLACFSHRNAPRPHGHSV